jgi:hypothetical protein
MYTFDIMPGLYVALGIFLLIAVRNPSANRSLIAFTVLGRLVVSGNAAATATNILGHERFTEFNCRLSFPVGLRTKDHRPSGKKWQALRTHDPVNERNSVFESGHTF